MSDPIDYTEEGPDGETWDVCPYADEIADDQTPCWCTPEQRHECAMDI